MCVCVCACVHVCVCVCVCVCVLYSQLFNIVLYYIYAYDRVQDSHVYLCLHSKVHGMALWYIHSLISDPVLPGTLSGSALDTLFHLSLFVMCSDLIASERSFAVLTWLRKKLLDIQSKTESSMGERARWARKHASLWSLRCLKHFKIALPTSSGLCSHISPPEFSELWILHTDMLLIGIFHSQRPCSDEYVWLAERNASTLQ